MQTKLKFRHIFPEPHKEKYEQVKPATASSDANLMESNGKYLAFSWQVGGGGSLVVLPNDKTQRLPPNPPHLRGHTGPIQDQDFNPFNDNMIATCSDDTTVRVWEFPEELTEDVTEALVVLQGHGRKVNFVEYHPTAEHILASASMDATVKVWDVEKQKEALSITAPEAYFSLEWNHNGSLIGVATRDKTARIGDPRAQKWTEDFASHDGPKAHKFCWLGTTGLALTCGFSKTYEREFKVWDLKNLKEP